MDRIAAAGAHSLALAKDGRVFSWGMGAGGRLGHGDDRNRIEPTEIAALADKGIRTIDAGAECSCASGEGGLYWWGADGGLGYVVDEVQQRAWREPTRCADAPKDVAAVACGGGLAAGVVVANGTAYKLGWSAADGVAIRRPLAVPDVVAAACADEHYVLLTEDGGVFSAGNGEHGRLGHGNRQSKHEPARVAIGNPAHRQSKHEPARVAIGNPAPAKGVQVDSETTSEVRRRATAPYV